VPRKKVEPRPAENLSIASLSDAPPITKLVKDDDRTEKKITKRRGRPVPQLESLNEKTIAEIGQLARLGMNERLIAGAIGISVSRMQKWKDESEQFRSLLERERERFVADNLMKLRNHASTSPQSAQWLLERVRPEEFSAKTELRISGGVSNTTTMDISPSVCQLLAEARSKPIDAEVLSISSSSSDQKIS